MVASTKLYDILDVSPDASEAEIKRAYKKLAIRLHPDKNTSDPNAQEKFKEVSHAASILLDAEKRELYDRTGNDSDSHEGGGDPTDIFQYLFGDHFGFSGRSRRNAGPPKTKDVQYVLEVSLEELYVGKTAKLAMRRQILCAGCSGSGGRPGVSYKCRNCDGNGVCFVTQQMGPLLQQYQTPCRMCSSTGSVVPDKERCARCHGKRTVEERHAFEVVVRRGMRDGHTFSFPGEAGQEPGKVAGDVIVVLKEGEHPRFKRRNADILTMLDIDLVTALTGGDVPLKHLDGTTILLHIEPGTVLTPGCLKTVPRRGFPIQDQPCFGDLYVKFNVVFPSAEEISPAQREMLRKALPSPQLCALPSNIKRQECEQCLLHECRGQPGSSGQRNSDDDDDSDHHGRGHSRRHAGPGGMQCQTQ